MTRPSRVLVLVAALLAISSALPAWAQTDPSEVSGNEMADGPWTGWFTAAGVETYAEEGVTATVSIEDSGTFSFTVADGSTSGTWLSAGTNIWHTDPGQPAMLTGTSNLTSSGSIAGDRTNLTGTGTTSQSGTLVIEASGQTITRPISSNTPLTFSMTVTGVSCEAATGTLTGSFIRGSFIAINGASFDGDVPAEERVALIDGLAAYQEDFNNFTNGLGWGANAPEGASMPDVFPIADFMDLMADAEAALNELRNASACVSLQVGEDLLERWDTPNTAEIASVIESAAGAFAFRADTVRAIVNAGFRVGAIGSGATDQTAAASAEEALRSQMEEIVNESVGAHDECANSDSCIFGTQDVFTAAVIGSQMGWTYEVVRNVDGEARSISAGRLLQMFSVGSSDGSE